MKEIIESLQKEVYKTDWKIAQAAQDLEKDDNRSFDWYNECCAKKTTLLEVIEKLKPLA